MKLPALLLEFQKKIIRAVCSRLGANDAAETLLVTDKMPAEAQLAMYRQGTASGYVGVLKEIYPVIYALVGEAFFYRMMEIFVERHPTLLFNMKHYGEDMVAFLANFQPVSKLPYLPDIARLEWAWHQAAIAPDELGFNFEALGQIDANKQTDIIFLLPQSARLIYSQYPIYRIWEVNQADFKGEQTVNLDDGPEVLLVWRDRRHCRIEQLTREEAIVLSLFAKRLPFSEICERLENFDSMPTAAALLPHYLQRRWIVSFAVP